MCIWQHVCQDSEWEKIILLVMMLEFEWYNVLHSSHFPGSSLSASFDTYENAAVVVICNCVHYAQCGLVN